MTPEPQAIQRQGSQAHKAGASFFDNPHLLAQVPIDRPVRFSHGRSCAMHGRLVALRKMLAGTRVCSG